MESGRTGRGGRARRVEFASVRVAGTINIPLDELEKRAREMPAGEVVIMDHGGGQAGSRAGSCRRQAGPD